MYNRVGIYAYIQVEKNWAQCLVDDLRVFRAIEGSTESVPVVFGVETVLAMAHGG